MNAPECTVCGHPGLRPDAHADWCAHVAAWLAAIEPPNIIATRAFVASRRAVTS